MKNYLANIKNDVIVIFIVIMSFIGSFLCYVFGAHNYGEPKERGKLKGCSICKRCGKIKRNYEKE